MRTMFSGKNTALIFFTRLLFLIAAAGILLTALSCSRQEEEVSSAPREAESESPFAAAVFVPGIIAGSATYEMLVDGAQQAADEYDHATVQVIEGGSNQGEWEEKVSALAASGDYDVIVTSNPAMPAIADAVSKKFPDQRFIVLDGFFQGNDMLYTLRYNQSQQAELAGHMAGLVTVSSMEGANGDLKIGLIAGQEYPDMNELILPGFTEGARRVDADITVDFRVVGNWYDAAKGAELARSMIDSGVDVILTIAGGANQGVVTAAAESGTYVHWYDSNGYANEPGTVIGSTAIRQDKAVYETLMQAIEGTLDFGTAETLGIENGYITFIEDDPIYQETVPEEIRNRQHEFITEFTAD